MTRSADAGDAVAYRGANSCEPSDGVDPGGDGEVSGAGGGSGAGKPTEDDSGEGGGGAGAADRPVGVSGNRPWPAREASLPASAGGGLELDALPPAPGRGCLLRSARPVVRPGRLLLESLDLRGFSRRVAGFEATRPAVSAGVKPTSSGRAGGGGGLRRPGRIETASRARPAAPATLIARTRSMLRPLISPSGFRAGSLSPRSSL
jgi:hypothetical protein